jgi:hypothetical protein
MVEKTSIELEIDDDSSEDLWKREYRNRSLPEASKWKSSQRQDTTHKFQELFES